MRSRANRAALLPLGLAAPLKIAGEFSRAVIPGSRRRELALPLYKEHPAGITRDVKRGLNLNPDVCKRPFASTRRSRQQRLYQPRASLREEVFVREKLEILNHRFYSFVFLKI